MSGFVELHQRYFNLNLQLLPSHYTSADTSRMTLAFFCLSGLDLLGVTYPHKQNAINWVYSLLIQGDLSGFRGGSGDGCQFDPTNSSPASAYDKPHLAMTYTALLTLLILGDDLKRVNKTAILNTLKKCQQPNGSFSPTTDANDEADMRFLYCACTISYILNDWSAIDIKMALNFIKSCQNYDGAFGTCPSGSTYCAVASLTLMKRVDFIHRDKLILWLLSRQHEDDTCYAYWIGGSLEMLGAYSFVQIDELEKFLETTKSRFGGYGKVPDSYPDVMHSYMGLAGLAIAGKSELSKFYSPLGVSLRAVEYGKSLGFCNEFSQIPSKP
ncbi:Geranylgeranyl transferase type-1 subunit beta [Globomyces sp. JEL0801]|nr:Geranylgeranyl transferase type-1 subunit beta [Globomyces sp. JEL0801]